MKKFKYFLLCLFALFSQAVFAQEITLVWGDTLSKLIFQHHGLNLSNWKVVLPLYLSLNPQIENPNLIYAEEKLTLPSQKRVLAYINAASDLGFDDNEIQNPSVQKRTSLIDRVANPWSIEWQVGPYLKASGKASNALEYNSQGGFDMNIKSIYHLSDKYSIGLSSKYSKKTYLSNEANSAKFNFTLKEAYLESYMNWDLWIISVLFGVKDRLAYGPKGILLAAQHLDYGVGVDYRLIKEKNWSGLVGIKAVTFTASSSLPVGVNQSGHSISARATFNYNFWKNHLIGVESVYSLSQGKNQQYDINLEDFITRIKLQFNF
ncbi:MAG: hypothetical protein HAW63_02225 [Bdellovibrionaceae bacterium]|nr:hypothetical protein [Pseudobdellovibrionaceae bacterium]